MPWIHLDLVGQREQLLVDACVEVGGVLTRTARQIRPTDGADEQRVARQHEPRLGSALQIRHQETDALR